MSQPPLKIDVEKTFRIDNAGNVEIERSWFLTNQTRQDVDISELVFYVRELGNMLANAKAKDPSGSLDLRPDKQGSETKLSVFPRIKTLSSRQKYKMTVLYQFPSNVHKLGDVWLFTDTISGMDVSSFANLISNKMDIRLRVVLPKLKKRVWQSIFHESAPLCRELTEEEKDSQDIDNIVFEWASSLSSDYIYRAELIYGVKTNTQLTNFLIALGTTIITALVSYGFSLLLRG